MSYTTSGISDVRVQEYDGGIRIAARSTHTNKVIQCYASGELVAWQDSPAEDVEFDLAGLSSAHLLLLLAVDVEDAATNYWDDAFGTPSSCGNRIKFRVPQTIAPYRPQDRIRFYRGDAGDADATILVHEQDFYPGGRRCGGFGFHFGYGGFGWDGYDCKGFGYNFGLGEFGFDCEMIEVETVPLPPGEYRWKATVLDAAGNESTAASGTVTLDTYARPASDLAVQSYDKETDALTLSFTGSEDLT